MSSTPPGWHPDPSPSPTSYAPLLRYWDGSRWTEHTAAYPTYPAGTKAPQTTPDGEPLAGWWHRVGAYVIDSTILFTIAVLLALPWWRDVIDTYLDYINQAMADAEAGRQTSTDAFELQSELWRPLAMIALIGLVVGFAYNVGFLMWRQATPGKLVTGLRVRRREVAGPMPLGTVVARWASQFGVAILSIVPFVGSAVGLYYLLDDLWPLWDDKRQAIHDKVARTNVVRS